jgi:hypothetical protein
MRALAPAFAYHVTHTFGVKAMAKGKAKPEEKTEAKATTVKFVSCKGLRDCKFRYGNKIFKIKKGEKYKMHPEVVEFAKITKRVM